MDEVDDRTSNVCGVPQWKDGCQSLVSSNRTPEAAIQVVLATGILARTRNASLSATTVLRRSSSRKTLVLYLYLLGLFVGIFFRPAILRCENRIHTTRCRALDLKFSL